MAQTVLFDALVKMELPGTIDPIEFSRDLYPRHTKIKMQTALKLENVTLTMPDGKRMVVPLLLVESITAIALPVVDGDNLITFRMEKVDEPTVVEDSPCL